MSKLDIRELFGEDSDDEEIIIPPMPKFKSKIERRGNIEEDIPEDIAEPEILSYKSDDSEEPTDILFFSPEEESIKEKEDDMEEEIQKPKELEDSLKKNKTDKCPPGKVYNPKTGRCVKDKSKKKNNDDDDTESILTPSVAEFVENVISAKEIPCPPGKVRNPKTGRCVKNTEETSKKKISKKEPSKKEPSKKK